MIRKPCVMQETRLIVTILGHLHDPGRDRAAGLVNIGLTMDAFFLFSDLTLPLALPSGGLMGTVLPFMREDDVVEAETEGVGVPAADE